MTEVKLFTTCLAEEFFPEVGAAVATLLKRLDLKVSRPRAAFCCGQVAFNEGLRDEAKNLARRFLQTYDPGTAIVVPSGSCASMLKVFYDDLLAEDPRLLEKARALRPWIWEFSEFLVKAIKVTDVGARFPRAAVYHPACHLMRELKIKDEPLLLLRSVRELKLCELADRDECCGFGGLFSVKFPDISAAMLEAKLSCIIASRADVVVANDPGCLMQIGGGLHRCKVAIETRHLAEVLAAR